MFSTLLMRLQAVANKVSRLLCACLNSVVCFKITYCPTTPSLQIGARSHRDNPQYLPPILSYVRYAYGRTLPKSFFPTCKFAICSETVQHVSFASSIMCGMLQADISVTCSYCISCYIQFLLHVSRKPSCFRGLTVFFRSTHRSTVFHLRIGNMMSPGAHNRQKCCHDHKCACTSTTRALRGRHAVVAVCRRSQLAVQPSILRPRVGSTSTRRIYLRLRDFILSNDHSSFQRMYIRL
jgi:hypothetical protein